MSTRFCRNAVYEATLAHLNRVVADTPFLRDPFPHIFIDPFFPSDIYEHLQASFPAVERYQPFSYGKHAATDGSSSRDRFALTNDSLATLPPDCQDFWLGIRDALGCETFKAAVFRKLAPGLAIRTETSEKEAAEVPGFPLPELLRERSGYVIKPHPDTRKKIITMQIALPRNELHADLGTEFYKRSLNPLRVLREPRGFIISKTMPFVPNVAYAFTVINSWRLKSWHGRTRLPTGPVQRDTILTTWYSNPEQANQDILAEHYGEHVRTRKAA